MVYKVLAGDQYKDLGYMRADPREERIKKLLFELKSLGVEIQNHTHQNIYSKRDVKVEASGIVYYSLAVKFN